MSTWFVIYIGTAIAGTVGPLPYDMDECWFRATVQNVQAIRQVENGKTDSGEEITPLMKLVHYGCVQAPDRPALTFGDGPLT